ncbi:divalent-cation tolerance protein CutA [Balneolaceae bacterium ANBcel3]|nr:divalent-cation tolerance protein CutA [Balneolaceae bacterium ANBcel3]
MIDCFLVYITTSDRNQAETIGNALIEEKLAACVNLIDPITSIFKWDNNIEKEKEIVVLAKTTSVRYPALEQRVKELHSYDCPCIVALPITSGNPDFLSWIEEETRL